MHRDSIGKCHHPQVPVAKFRDLGPKPISAGGLERYANRTPGDVKAPLFAKVGSFPENAVLKVVRETALVHGAASCCVVTGIVW